MITRICLCLAAAALITDSPLMPKAGTSKSSGYRVTLAWDPVTNVSLYHLYYGTNSRAYPRQVAVTNATTVTVSNLTAGTWFFAVTATGTNGLESNYSAEIARAVPKPITNVVTIWAEASSNAVAGWGRLTNWQAITLTNPPGDVYYRLQITREAQ